MYPLLNKISLHINLASPQFIISERGNNYYNDSNAEEIEIPCNVEEVSSPLSKRLAHNRDSSKSSFIRHKEADSERVYRIYLNPVCWHFNNK